MEEASDGEAAHRDGAGPRPDVVLLDLNIPGCAGATVLETLKADPSTADVLRDHRDRDGGGGRRKALSAGGRRYITKPFSPLALLRTVERVLRGSASSGS